MKAILNDGVVDMVAHGSGRATYATPTASETGGGLDAPNPERGILAP